MQCYRSSILGSLAIETERSACAVVRIMVRPLTHSHYPAHRWLPSAEGKPQSLCGDFIICCAAADRYTKLNRHRIDCPLPRLVCCHCLALSRYCAHEHQARARSIHYLPRWCSPPKWEQGPAPASRRLYPERGIGQDGACRTLRDYGVISRP
jgi:hypothetical protein